MANETRWIWLALDLLALAPQTDQVLRQRGELMAELLRFQPKKANAA